VNDIATVALAITIDKHVQRQGIGLAMTVAYTRAPPKFVEDGASGKGTDGKAHVGPDVVYTCQREYSGTNGGGKSGNA